MIESYSHEFQNLAEKLQDKEASNKRKRDLNEFNNALIAINSDLKKTLPCADLIIRLDPENTRTNSTTIYLSLLEKAKRLSNSFNHYFGSELEDLPNIAEVSAFVNGLNEIKDDIDSLNKEIQKFGDKLTDDLETALKKYNSAKNAGLDLSSIQEQVFNDDIKEYQKIFKNISTIYQKISDSGVSKMYDQYIDLSNQLQCETHKLDEIISHAPILSEEALSFLKKLDSGSRVLLRDINPEILHEIQEKSPNICTNYAMRQT